MPLAAAIATNDSNNREMAKLNGKGRPELTYHQFVYKILYAE